MGKLFLSIDTQLGFQEGGNLAVNGGVTCGEKQKDYLKDHKNEYTAVLATVDWHPITHCSFKNNGGIWPVHCVQHSVDAAIYNPLLDVLVTCPHFEVLTKGCDEDHEEYSIFKNEASRKKLIGLVEALNIDEIHVGGIALDVCVLNTIKDGKRILPNVKWVLFKDFCASIKSPEETLKILDEMNVEIV